MNKGGNVFDALNKASSKKSKKGSVKDKEAINWKNKEAFPTDSNLSVGDAKCDANGQWTVAVTGASGHATMVDINHLGLHADRAGRPLRFQEREVTYQK